ncbi:MAG: penicillin-binding protein 2 [Gemmatimonadales bacterium]
MKAFHAHLLDQRLRLARGVVWGTLAIILLAFFRTQILKHQTYRMQSETNRLRAIPRPAPRGVIVDRNGRVLAENVPGYTVALLPAPAATLRPTLQRIARIAGRDSAWIAAVLARARKMPYQPVAVLSDAPFEVVSALEERRITIPGLIIQTEPRRYYPDSTAVAHLVGYVGEVAEGERGQPRLADVRLGGLVGKDGLEREYDDTLRGRDGVRFVEVSALGHLIREAGAAPPLNPVPGAPVQTTIDLELQLYIARIFPAGGQGAVIALNPNTGEILALFSAPAFNPNALIGGADPGYWRELNESEGRPLFDRAIQGTYPPGSVWKLAIAAMALRRGIVNSRSHMPIPCRGGMAYGNRFFRCWRAEGHGSLDLVEAIAHSCDVYFYQLGLKLTLNSLLEDAGAWGLRQRTGIDLPGEVTPEFPPSTAYYDQLYGSRGWTSAVTLNLAIGQGENAQTLIGMVRLFQMLASDGRARTPYVVRAAERSGASLDLPPDQLTVLREAMINVVEQGTARGSRVAGLRIAGKTGTAQNPHGPDHGWYIGFAPAEHPEIVVGAIIEHSRHGSSVARLVARVIARYLGADSTAAPEFRMVLPADSAPEPIQVLPTPPVDSAGPDTTDVEPPARDR